MVGDYAWSRCKHQMVQAIGKTEAYVIGEFDERDGTFTAFEGPFVVEGSFALSHYECLKCGQEFEEP